MRRLQITLTCFCFVLLCAAGLGKVQASHLYGAQITYECINACTTRVNLRAYRDCSGSSTIVNAIYWLPEQPGCTAPPALGNSSPQTTTELTPLCPTASTQCTTPGAPLHGFQEYYWFRDYDVCAVPACTYRLYYGDCCRNPAITAFAVVGSQGFAISDTWIQTGLSQCNSSPVFRQAPRMYLAQGQDHEIDLGATDPDGDSLVYALSTCYSANSVACIYDPGYGPTTPLGPSWNVSLDSATGLARFDAVPGSIVMGVTSLTVDEYRNGLWIGRVQHDFQMTVLSSPANALPQLIPFSNPSPNVSFTGNHAYICGPGSVCFDIATSDNNAGQNLTLTWQNLPGATFTQVGAPAVQDSIFGTSANPPVGRFCWTPPGPGRYVAAFRVTDDACPLYGIQDLVVLLEVGSGSTASATLGTCPSVNFTASPCYAAPGYTYTWSGDGGFSSSLQSPSYTYPAVGDYAWQVIVSNGSVSDTIRDSVHISGDPVYLPSLFIPDTIALGPCLGATVATLTYQGTYAAYMSSTGTTTSSFWVNQPGTYHGWAFDTAGCAFMDSVIVTWTAPDISGLVTGSTNQVLAGQKVYLIRYDSVAQTLFAADSSITDPTGAYFFCGVIDSVVFLKAAPDSAAYPLELPTYADTALFWSQAIAFHPFASLPIFHNFATLPGTNPGGPGFIGGLITQGANKTMAPGDPVPGLTVVLREAVSGTAFAVTRTDANGYFRFNNLPLGDYQIVPDKPAVSITNVPQVSITAAVPSRDSLDFRLNSTFLELHVSSAVLAGSAIRLQASPNPFVEEMGLLIDLPAATTVAWEVRDIQGRLVAASGPATELATGLHSWRLGRDWSPGIYLLQVQADGRSHHHKLLKSH